MESLSLTRTIEKGSQDTPREPKFRPILLATKFVLEYLADKIYDTFMSVLQYIVLLQPTAYYISSKQSKIARKIPTCMGIPIFNSTLHALSCAFRHSPYKAMPWYGSHYTAQHKMTEIGQKCIISEDKVYKKLPC
jgi:hypothetical protein